MKSLSAIIENNKMWAEVVGFEGHYVVSNTGDICSMDRTVVDKNGVSRVLKGQPISSRKDKGGYLMVTLNKGGVVTTHKVHRLVACAFIENPNEFPEVNHKNENRANNYVYNLEWCTRQYNQEYSNAGYYKVLTPNGFLLDVFNLNKFCKENNLIATNMHQVSIGKQSHCKGYKVWRIK